MFSGGIERDQWYEIGEVECKLNESLPDLKGFKLLQSNIKNPYSFHWYSLVDFLHEIRWQKGDEPVMSAW